MTFLEPGAEPRPKQQTEAREPIPPWTLRRAAILGLPVLTLAAAASTAWFWLDAELFSWRLPAVCAGIAMAAVAWSIRLVRRRELRAIEIWQAVAESMPDARKRLYAVRRDSYFVWLLYTSPSPRD